jgi:hypothetical protein
VCGLLGLGKAPAQCGEPGTDSDCPDTHSRELHCCRQAASRKHYLQHTSTVSQCSDDRVTLGA